jgi:hypothetical protein
MECIKAICWHRLTSFSNTQIMLHNCVPDLLNERAGLKAQGNLITIPKSPGFKNQLELPEESSSSNGSSFLLFGI